MKQLLCHNPIDAHLHLRDGAALSTTVLHSAEQFTQAIIMPNLTPPVGTVAAANAYKERILAALADLNAKRAPAAQLEFKPLFLLYLMPQTTEQDIAQAAANHDIVGFKWYPAGATTNSQWGLSISDEDNLYRLCAALQQHDLVLAIHGEVTDNTHDIFDREKIFIDKVLSKIRKDFPQLRIVLEHITTAYAADFIASQPNNTAATITVHHLRYNRNDLLAGGIKPHRYCLPILKRESDRVALNQAAISGDPRFFLGTDSAAHALSKKESSCGCAGIYSAPIALPQLAEIFAQHNALTKPELFNNFCSNFCRGFYKLAAPKHNFVLELQKSNITVPKSYKFADELVIPMAAGETLSWSIINH